VQIIIKNKRFKVELKMFYQTYIARKPPKVPVTMLSRHPVIPGSHGMVAEWSRVMLHVICSVRRTPYNTLSMGITQQFSRFCPW